MEDQRDPHGPVATAGVAPKRAGDWFRPKLLLGISELRVVYWCGFPYTLVLICVRFHI